jgi:CPA2 family monovalent cation:H+ antiporter-2
MTEHATLKLVVLLLATAVLTVVVFRRLKLPPILGYLIVGVVIGPHTTGLVPDAPGTRYLAEFGVVFLMFSIGLEFSLPQLVAMRRMVLGFGGLQVASAILATLAVAIAAGLGWQAGLIAGAVLAMSSTAIVSKFLSEQTQLHTPHGKAIMGVLLFQDMAVIPLIVLVPALALPGREIAGAIGAAMVKAAAALAVILVLGQRIMRPLFQLVAAQKSSELFVLAVLLVTLGLALATEAAGLSMALGAFLAGMLISETEYRYQVEDDIKPFRDVLLGLFFVTVGMLPEWNTLAERWAMVLLILLSFLALKFVLIVAIGMLLRNDRAVSLRAALALAPAGEFGFVLLSLAGLHGALADSTIQVLLAAMLLSMLLSPLILMNSERIVLRLIASEWESRAVALQQLAIKAMSKKRHVIICGYGRSGQSLARFLDRENISVVALDADPLRVRQAAAAGDSVLFGDAAKREVLTAAGLPRAAAVVVSFADTRAALAILSHVKALRPEVPVIVRTFDESDVDKIKAAGAAEIVAEVVEGSLMLGTQTMLRLGIPLKQALRRLRQVREEQYAFSPAFFGGITDVEEQEPTQPRLMSVSLDGEAAAIGQALHAMELERLGVRLTQLRRQGKRHTELSKELVLQEGDVLVLAGLPEALANAERRLLQG